MGKSLVIIGKGPSLHRCSKEFIDSFDHVAIINRPVYEGYENLISDHADFEFITEITPPYTKERNNQLNLKLTLNQITSGFKEYYKKWIHGKYGFDLSIDLYPDSGVLIFEHFVRDKDKWSEEPLLMDKYDKIGLVGFDLREVGKKSYYYKNEEAPDCLKYLWENGTYDKDGIYRSDSSGNPQRQVNSSAEYMNDTFRKYKDKEFIIISDYEFKEFDNVTQR
ncbi:hypothetical protein COB55_05540 [Candidatus Wolfebacteria bacterium]|nr:MAG: hypothetical protein COB55_05540 [Candidatus Wolfebacteria bacterium]